MGATGNTAVRWEFGAVNCHDLIYNSNQHFSATQPAGDILACQKPDSVLILVNFVTVCIENSYGLTRIWPETTLEYDLQVEVSLFAQSMTYR